MVEKTIKIIDGKGKVLAELSKIMKDVTVEEFKKILVSFNPFRNYMYLPSLAYKGLSVDRVNLKIGDTILDRRKTLNEYSNYLILIQIYIYRQ